MVESVSVAVQAEASGQDAAPAAVREGAVTEGVSHHANPLPLRLTGVGKEYRIYDSPRARLKSLLTGRALHRSRDQLVDWL